MQRWEAPAHPHCAEPSQLHQNLQHLLQRRAGPSISPGIYPALNTLWVPSFTLGIFLTQGLNLGLLHCRPILYHLSHLGSL